MNIILKKGVAFLLVFVMLLGVLPVLEISAATVSYETSYDETLKTNVIKNWGERGELATFLSPNAETFYSADFYDTYVTMSGSSNENNVPDSELYEALYSLMSSAHTTITDYDDLKEVFCYTDCENNGYTSSMISGFYSGIALKPAWDGGLTWNREHTWPQSKSTNGSDVEDIMSIRPESSSVNSSRGNKGYGSGSAYYDPNSVSGNGYNLHGDVARVILYTYVRWGGETEKNDGSTLQSKMWGTDGVFESVDVLLQWMEEDPVDTWEMGRNDSVQSITGTRNVFVDYPELAFVLFGAEIPEMDTPSGEAGSAGYTVTATSNNNSYGTVSVNNGYVTAHPAEGYKATGYQVVSGNATVTQNGNIFTVSATDDCTICINFTAKNKYTATFMGDKQTLSTQTVYDDYCVVFPAYSGSTPEGYTFRGWVASIAYNTKEKPATVYAAGSECFIESNTTFYALMSYVNENDTSGGNLTYKLVTSANQLSADKSVVIAAADYDKALSATQNSNNRGAVGISKGTDTLIFDTNNGVQVVTLVEGTVSDTYGFYTGSGYLYAASSSSNWLRTQSTLNENGSFKITVNDDHTCTVIAQGANARNNLLFNTQSSLFSCYANTSSNVKTICLYVGVAGGTTYYTTAWTYDPTEPENIVASGACGDNLTWKLDDEGTLTISGTGAMYDYDEDNRAPWGESITEVIMEEGVTSIGNYMFYCCGRLTSVTIPKGVTTIGDSAFEYCENLICVTIPDSITTIGNGAFSCCDSLTSVTIPEGVTSIGNAVFGCCDSLTSVTIPESVTSIGKDAFFTCLSLISVTIPESVTIIGERAFYGCSSLEKITFYGDAPSIGEDAFCDVTATANYPANNDTWTSDVMQDYGGTITWVADKPLIKTQPATQKIVAGKTAEFTVSASGDNITYQWQYRISSSGSWKNVSAASGKTASYSLTAETRHSSYQYRCKVTDSAGNVVYTNTAYLYVLGIKTQPTTQKVKADATAKFTVSATGANKTYQWQYKTSSAGSWQNVSAASGKTASYSLTAQSRHNGYYYRCRVKDSAGNTVYTKTVRLFVLAIKTQPVSKTVVAGKTAKLTVSATGNALKYQWYYRTSSSGSWKAVSAASGKTANYSLTAATRHHGYQYRCKITDSAGNTVYTEIVNLYVLGIKTQPVSKSVKVGATAKFAVSAVGKDLKYQWYYRTSSSGSWKAVSAASGKTANYSLTAQSRHNGYQYRCKITDSAGNVIYTNVVKLTVIE